VTGDTTDEPDETVIVTLSSPTQATLAEGGASGTGTITDDDAAPTVTLAVVPSAITESGTGNVSTVTATLDHRSSAATTVTVGATAGTNTANGDFRLSANPMLTIAAGRTSSTGTVTAVNNTRDEANKSVTVSGTATNSQGITQPADVDLTITDDDGAPAPSIDSPSVTEGDSGSATLTFTVSLSPVIGRQVTVNYAEGVGGTATAGTDYTALPAGTLTFAAGETSRTIAVSVTGDTVEDGDETVVMTLRSPTNAVLGTATGTGTIMDDDASPPRPNDEEPPPVPTDLVPSFGAQTVEDRAWKQGQKIVAFTLPAATGGDPPVRHDLQPDLPAGVTRTAFQVSGMPTVLVETTTYTWTATDADGDAAALTFTLSVAAQAVVSIADALAVEGSALAFPVTLSAAAPADVTLTWTTEPGTAQPAADYTPAPARSLTIPAGETTATVMVPTTDNDVAEPEETFTVRLAAAGLPG